MNSSKSGERNTSSGNKAEENDEGALLREWGPPHVLASSFGAVIIGASLIYIYLQSSLSSVLNFVWNTNFLLFLFGLIAGILITLGFSGRKIPRLE